MVAQELPVLLPKEEHEAREQRGRALAKAKGAKIKRLGKRWQVPSQQGAGPNYLVDLSSGTCTCLDFELRRVKCKHQHSVEFMIVWESNPDGTVTETVITRKTYSQPNWSAYHASQVHEVDRVEMLLSALCDGVVEPTYVFGRPGHLLRDETFAAAHKVYTTLSARRAQSDLRRCHERGYLTRPLSYNSVLKALENPDMTPVLKALIDESASVLADFESHFSPDSTGFETVTYRRHYDVKYGKETEDERDARLKQEEKNPRRDSVKLHAMVGSVTNVVTHAEVSNAGDCPMMTPLLLATAANFDIKEVSADKAYLSHANVELINEVGARPLIPFKVNSTGDGPRLWRKMYGEFMLHQPEFMARYHARSNAEAAFSMIKRVLGASVRSKLPVAQANEVYAKVLCHNLRCVVEATFMFGAQPEFWKKAA